MSITVVVPHNTLAMLEPSNRSERQLVAKEIFDCIVVTKWNPVSQSGDLVHIPAGSSGGLDYASTLAPDTGRFMPSAVGKITSIERQLCAMGVPKRAIALHTTHTRAEVTMGNRFNIGIDLRTGKTFFFSDPKQVLPNSPDRGYAELQDDTTDLYVVKQRG